MILKRFARELEYLVPKALAKERNYDQ